jgi:hypothetical protein
VSIKGTTESSSPRNGLPAGRPYQYGGSKRDALDLTRNQSDLLKLLDLAVFSEDVLAARWPTWTREAIRRAAGSLVDLGLATVVPDGWDITESGRAALEHAN